MKVEAEWLACADPQPMLEFLRRRASDRKARLFAVGCCRRIWPIFEHEEFREAVRKAEAFADGLAGRDEMLQANERALAIFVKRRGELQGKENGPAAALAASRFPNRKTVWERIADALDDPGWEDEMDKGDRLGVAFVTAKLASWAAAELQGENRVLDSPITLAERGKQAALVRCVFGNPFHPRPVPGEWLTSDVRATAEGIYAERAFDRLPLLADALEASGCVSANLIAHCRSGGEHARGCWVVDLVLGKD
jgi:hypothetical protein